MSSSDNALGRWVDLGVIAGGNFVQLGLRVLLGPLVPLLLLEFETSKATLGAILTGMWAVYALNQFPSGVLADKYGERALLGAGLAGTVAGAFLVAAAPTLPFFAGFALLLGAGAGIYFSPASSFISRRFAEHGAPLGALTASGSLAGVLFPLVGSLVAVRYDWRAAVLLGAATGLPVLLATLRYVPSPPPTNPDRSLWAAIDPDRIWRLLSQPSVAFTVGIGAMVGFAFQSLLSFFPTFLVEYHGFDTGTAGIAFAAMFGVSAIAQPIAGIISDRHSRDVALGTSVTVAATGLSTVLFTSSLAGLVVGMGLLGAGISWPGVLQARFMDQFTDSERGYGFGLVRTVYMFLAASGSVVVGAVADYSGWLLGYGTVTVLFAVCLGALGLNRTLDLDL